MSAALKPEASAPLARLRDLHVKFVTRDRTVHAVNGVDLDLAAGGERGHREFRRAPPPGGYAAVPVRARAARSRRSSTSPATFL